MINPKLLFGIINIVFLYELIKLETCHWTSCTILLIFQGPFWIAEFFPKLLCFFYKIKLIHMKLLYGSYEVPMVPQ